MTPKRGDVWLVDLGLAAKVRPCLVVSVPAVEVNERALSTLVPHTTSMRGSRFEVSLQVPFLKVGAFDAQNLITVPSMKLIRCLGTISSEKMVLVELAIKEWLGFPE